MTETERINLAALKAYPYDWAHGVDMNLGPRCGFITGVAYERKNPSPEVVDMEKALNVFVNESICMCYGADEPQAKRNPCVHCRRKKIGHEALNAYRKTQVTP